MKTKDLIKKVEDALTEQGIVFDTQPADAETVTIDIVSSKYKGIEKIVKGPFLVGAIFIDNTNSLMNKDFKWTKYPLIVENNWLDTKGDITEVKNYSKHFTVKGAVNSLKRYLDTL